MKFISYNAENGTLFYDNRDQPELLKGEVLLRVRAFGVNRADLLQKMGKYPPSQQESDILGLEASGEVVAVAGPSHQNLIGKRVFGLTPGGAYAEYVKVPAEHLMPLPESFDFAQGAAVAEVFLTAFQCLVFEGQLQFGETALIHAGASGVGSAAIQLAKMRGARVVVTVGSDEKAQFCLDLGADEAINYRQQDFAEVMNRAGIKADVIIDPIGASYALQNLKVAALDSRWLSIAMLGGRMIEQFDLAKLLARRVTLQATTLRNRSHDYKRRLTEEFQQTCWTCFNTGQLQPVIDQVFDWQNIDAAHAVLQQNSNMGKVVVLTD